MVKNYPKCQTHTYMLDMNVGWIYKYVWAPSFF